MRSSRMASFAVLLALVVPTAFADGLIKFKNWDSSPQSYFMTRVEREQWSAIKSDAAAQAFVDRYIASRGPGFEAEVATRAEQADKHLTLGKIPGSKTLRGKIIVVFGPPSALEMPVVTESTSGHRDSPVMAGALGGDSSGTGGSRSSDTEATSIKSPIGSSRTEQHYHLSYETTPSGPLDVTLVAEPNGKDRPKTREDGKKLDAAFEAAAQASIKSK